VFTGFWWRNLKEGDYLEDLEVDGIINLKLYLRNKMGDIDWLDLAQDRDRWQAVVNAAMNRRFP
jgi:hypothetical protein